MIRFLMFLFGKQYETCKSCDTLKAQLAIANSEKKELTDTLLGLLKPRVYEQTPTELQPMRSTAITFSKRRDMIEAAKREEARIAKASPLIGKPDNQQGEQVRAIETLEQEVGIDEELKKNG